MSLPSISLLEGAGALPHPPGSTVFRHSALSALISLIVIDGFATGLAIGIAFDKIPSIAWIAVVLLLALTPWLVRGLTRSLSPANWILRVDHDAMFVQFRSLYRKPSPDALTACRIPYSDIAAARLIEEQFAGRSRNRTESWTEQSLEIQLEQSTGGDLFLAIHDDRASNVVDPTTGAKRKFALHHYPVRMPDPYSLRIKFSGRRDCLGPGIRKALEQLSSHCEIDDPAELDYRDPKALEDPQFDEALLSLVESGQLFAAIHYLMQRTSCSLTEARDSIHQLLGPGSESRPAQAA